MSGIAIWGEALVGVIWLFWVISLGYTAWQLLIPFKEANFSDRVVGIASATFMVLLLIAPFFIVPLWF